MTYGELVIGWGATDIFLHRLLFLSEGVEDHRLFLNPLSVSVPGAKSTALYIEMSR